jgi:hypothetical protein
MASLNLIKQSVRVRCADVASCPPRKPADYLLGTSSAWLPGFLDFEDNAVDGPLESRHIALLALIFSSRSQSDESLRKPVFTSLLTAPTVLDNYSPHNKTDERHLTSGTLMINIRYLRRHR